LLGTRRAEPLAAGSGFGNFYIMCGGEMAHGKTGPDRSRTQDRTRDIGVAVEVESRPIVNA
jgi:hypothetical protein